MTQKELREQNRAAVIRAAQGRFLPLAAPQAAGIALVEFHKPAPERIRHDFLSASQYMQR